MEVSRRQPSDMIAGDTRQRPSTSCWICSTSRRDHVGDLLGDDAGCGHPTGRRGRRSAPVGRRSRSRSCSSTMCSAARSPSDAERDVDPRAPAASSCAAPSTAPRPRRGTTSSADYLERNGFLDRLLEQHPGAVDGLADLAGLLVAPAGRWLASTPAWSPSGASSTGCGRSSRDGERWFDPDHDIGYPDRIRRREPGAEAKGLAAHVDSPSAGGWRIAENQRVFAPLLTDGLDAYDPFDAAYRTGDRRRIAGRLARRSARSRVGRRCRRCIPTTACCTSCRSRPRSATGSSTVWPASSDCSATNRSRRRAATLATTWCCGRWCRSRASSRVTRCGGTAICTTRSGDAANDSRWGNVMYIGAAPRCPRNDVYAETTFARFVAARSPVDFPADDFEVDFVGRATADDLERRRPRPVRARADTAGEVPSPGLAAARRISCRGQDWPVVFGR